MKGMILAAGKGTRLGELGKQTPKALTEAGGKTMLEYAVEHLKSAGVTSLIINLHHLGQQIEDFVLSHNYFGISITFSYEDELLDTGGGLKKVRYFFENEECFFLRNCDIYSELDLNKLLQDHQKNRPLVTLAVTKRDTNRYLVFAENLTLNGIENVKTGLRKLIRPSADCNRFAFLGIHVLSPEIFNFFPEDQSKFSIIDSYITAATAGAAIRAFPDPAYWIDTGTVEKLELLDKRWRQLKQI